MVTLALLSALAFLPLPADVRLLACAAQTEADGRLGIKQYEAGRWVAHVALNRADAGWWGTLEQTLRRDFHGIHLCGEPEPWAVEVAMKAMGEDDPTGGAYFVLSTDDLNNLGWMEPTQSLENGCVGLHFYRRWHWQ